MPISKLTFLKRICQKRLYIYGGHDIREGSLKNMWMLDFNKFDDLDLEPEDQDRCCEWIQLEPKDL